MACLNPLKGYRIYNEKTGLWEIKLAFQLHLEDHDERNAVEVPCGKCVGCRLAKASEWAMRCQLEAKQFDCNYFLTLTYDDAHLPVRNHKSVDVVTGELIKDHDVATLVPEHFTKFMKDLRRYYEYHYGHKGIRFFAAGEYGSKSWRPHYHLIAFNLPIPDLQVYKESFTGDTLFNSPSLGKIWGKGFVVVGAVNFDSCSYVARYTLKKIGIPKQEYEERGLEPEFVRMSRRPAIGFEYFRQNAEKIKKYDNIVIAKGDKPVTYKPPRYFEKFMDDDEIKQMKSKRIEVASLASDIEMLGTDLDRESYLKLKLENKSQKSKTLKREL